MKRFYKEAAIGPEGAILLDGRAVKTPMRQALRLPTAALAEAVRAEWQAQGEEVDPRSMRMTGLSNAAIDRVVPDPTAFALPLARYAETDLLCYRAESPAELIVEEAAAWDPLLAWARTRFDVRFEIVNGIVHRAQPEATAARLTEALVARDAFALAAMNPLVTIGGSLVTALALTEGAISAEDAFDTLHLDELWQARHWGEDALATQAREAKREDFLAAARFLSLL